MVLLCVLLPKHFNGTFEQWFMSNYNKINGNSTEECEILTQTHVIGDEDNDTRSAQTSL